MKILVAVKRVADPHLANELKLVGDRVQTEGVEYKLNPLDEGAVEAALRLTEDGAAPKERHGEVVVVTLGPPEAEAALRAALACGAQRAIHIIANDEALDARTVAHALAAVVVKETPDLILLGRKTVDGESGAVGPMLASRLDYPLVNAATQVLEQDGTLLVRRLVQGGSCVVRVKLPALVTVDLRIVASDGCISSKTSKNFEYYEGIRFAALPAIMKARKKPLEKLELEQLVPGVRCSSQYQGFETTSVPRSTVMLSSVAELAHVLTKSQVGV